MYAELAWRGLFFIPSLIIGIRLLVIFRHKRKLPELLMAICLLSSGVVYNLLRELEALFALPPPGYELIYEILRRLTVELSAAAVGVFAWWMFRRRSHAARLLSWLLCTVLFAWALEPLFVGASEWQSRGIFQQLRAMAGLLCYLWVAAESLFYFRRLRRQLRAGIEDDPALASTALFISLSCLSFAAIWGTSLGRAVAAHYFGIDLPVYAWTLPTVGAIRALCLWLAFAPPDAYERWLRRTKAYEH